MHSPMWIAECLMEKVGTEKTELAGREALLCERAVR